MVYEQHKEVQKASTSKGAESPIYDATHNENENESSSNFEGLNYGGFMNEEYHGNEKLKVERFQRMLRDDIREVISLFKCTTLDDLLSRARVRKADLLRKKNKEAKESKRKIILRD
nr:zinc finger, CCHC-type, retrotransposon Gag domain protein [Tanacetum cinerariifolium]